MHYKFLLEGSPSSRQETRSCLEFSKSQQNNSYTYFISVSKNIASSRPRSQLCQGPVVYTSADFVLSTFTCMLVSSGKRVFDGGQGSSSSGTNDKKEDGCQLGDTWPMATLCTKRWINHMRHITCSLKPPFAHENCLIFAGIGSGLHCYQILIFTYAYALIFIHRCFGSLFWLLGVLIRSLFHKKGVLIGSLSQSLGVLISFRDSA